MKRMPWQSIAWAGMLVLVLASAAAAQAEEPRLTLRLRRYFGYGGFGGEIQGTFRLIVNGPADLKRVVFWMDAQQIGEDTESPFELQFETGNFAPGPHTMRAVGYTAGGLELHSNEAHAKFLTAEEAERATTGIIVPLLGGVFGLLAISFVFTWALSRRKGSTPGHVRNYSIAGGAICPRCRKPFALHLFSPNLGWVKLARCPYCGKWSLVRAASREELVAAEVAELEQAASAQVSAWSEEEQLRHALDDSRFLDQ